MKKRDGSLGAWCTSKQRMRYVGKGLGGGGGRGGVERAGGAGKGGSGFWSMGVAPHVNVAVLLVPLCKWH